MKILIVDDLPANTKLLDQFLTILGHQTVIANNGQEALDLFQTEKPDMVLMDVMMPVMDGYTATTKIRQLQSARWVPIIFLTALTQDEDLVKGLESGGDDYLPKPINMTVLEAKIKSMQRIALLQDELAEKNDTLLKYYNHAEEEQLIGSHIMRWITGDAVQHEPLIRHQLRPVEHFCGDLLISARTPADTLHILLADAVGHGLTAAVNVMPLIQVFYSMTKTGLSISSIARELNLKINKFMPVDRFIATTLVSIDRRERVIEVWNGGNPAPLLIDKAGAIVHKWKSNYLPIGILNDHVFSSKPEAFKYDEACQLLLFSDGFQEAASPQGEQFGYERIVSLLGNTAPERRFDALTDELDRHLGDKTAHDDISYAIVEVASAMEDIIPASQNVPAKIPDTSDYWKFELCLGASELKYLDVVPMLTQIISRINTTSEHSGQLFMILSELFNNALDHGILGLDSSLKSGPDGFENFLEQRDERLQALSNGMIEIKIEHIAINDDFGIVIRIKDSGRGFNHDKYQATNMAENIGAHSRGIGLVKTIAHSLEYLGSGNEVVARYVYALGVTEKKD